MDPLVPSLPDPVRAAQCELSRRPRFPQKMKETLAQPLQVITVVGPISFFVEVNTLLLKTVHLLNDQALGVDRCIHTFTSVWAIFSPWVCIQGKKMY